MTNDALINEEFKSIRFGNIDARTEMNDSPDLLVDGFLDENGYIDKLIKQRFFLVYGLKGSGKTAIGSKLILMSQSNSDLFVEQYTLERFNYTLFEGMGYNFNSTGKKDGARTHSRKMHEVENLKAWEIVLNSALLGMFANDSELKSKSNGYVCKVIEGLKEIGALHSGDFSTIVRKMSKSNIEANIKILKYKHTSSKESENSYDAAYDNLRHAVLDSALSKKHIMVIDGVDSIVSEREIQNRVLSGLLHAVSEINSDLCSSKINAKIVLLCRKDLLDMLKDPNKQKIIGDYGLELDWYDHGAERNNINLIKLVNLRARLSLGRDVDVFEKYFGKMVGKKETYKFILDYTRHIPRDMVRLMNEIQKNYAYNKMSPEKFRNAVNSYSADYFYAEVQDELVGIMSEKETRTVFRLISEIKKYRSSMMELTAKAKELNVDLTGIELERLLSLLYDIGAIGNVRKHDNTDKYSFKYRDRWSSFNPREEFVVHLALQKALNVRGGYQSKDVDYD